VIIFFEEHVSDKNVKTAMRLARNLRRALREAEGVKAAAKSVRLYNRTLT
jgi:hypothetical protein